MRIIDNIKGFFGSKPAPQIQNITYGQDIYEAFGVAASGENINPVSALRVSAVYACVSKISCP